MQLLVKLPIWMLFFVLLVVVFCEPASPQPTRCMALCLRSDAEDSCQRCRLRVPMRFGKRFDNEATRLRIPMRFGKRNGDFDDRESVSMVGSSLPDIQRSIEDTPVERSVEMRREPASLDIPENWFYRVLNNPSLATYDERRPSTDYDQDDDQ